MNFLSILWLKNLEYKFSLFIKYNKALQVSKKLSANIEL